MPQNIPLLVHNIGYGGSILIILFLIIFIFVKDRHSVANRMLLFSFISAQFFLVSHIIAVNIQDGDISRQILTFNLSNIYIGVFITHCVLAFLGKTKEQRRTLICIDAISVALTAFFLLVPDAFLLPSVPKMYFPNYYEGGSMYWVLICWNIGVAVYFMYQMARAYPTADALLKNRLKYFLTATALGYLFGIQAYPLVINIYINPAWGALMAPTFAVIFAYAILKYDLLDIRIVFKQAFIYSILVAAVGIFIVSFNFLNTLIITNLPGFPLWLLPLLSSSIAVAIGFFVWNKFRQGELLKYEFITVVTHKFRTPLVHIKWAAENLSKKQRMDEDQAQVAYIQSANAKLVELTGLLMSVSESESSAYTYRLERNNLTAAVEDVLSVLTTPLQSRRINLVKQLEAGASAHFDVSRIRFVIQTFIENAINYSPVGGTVTVVLKPNGSYWTFSVTDAGIGIAKGELPLLFSKFYRGKQAKLTDTEGMGIGLYISKEVIKRHHGKLWAESPGPEKGSTFAFSIPKAQ